MPDQQPSSSSSSPGMVHTALGSASAGIVSRLLTHPLDTAKARLQDVHGNYRSTWDVFHRSTHLGSLYRGFGAVIVGGTPGTMLYLCSYESIKTGLSRRLRPAEPENDAETFWVHLSSGMLAEAIACVIYVPVDVIKERLQVNTGLYRNEWDALRVIARQEGLAGGLYKGYGATLASFGPFSALYFVFYEKFKRWAGQRQRQTATPEQRHELSFHHYLVCSCAAGGLASWLTSPLDMAKLRLQVQRATAAAAGEGEGSAVTYRGMVDCLSKTYQTQGVRGLFRGAGARVLHFAPATTITMTCYETFRNFFERHV